MYKMLLITFHELNYLIFTQPFDLDTITITLTFQMRKPRSRVVKALAQGHTATKWQNEIWTQVV